MMASGKQELTIGFRAEEHLLEMFQNSTADVKYSFFGRHFKDVQRACAWLCASEIKAINSAFPFWKNFKKNKKNINAPCMFQHKFRLNDAINEHHKVGCLWCGFSFSGDLMILVFIYEFWWRNDVVSRSLMNLWGNVK
jgi:hypothetical protein